MPRSAHAVCINPLDEARDPKAEFRLLLVQFLDGSTFGDIAKAQDVLRVRVTDLNALRKLAEPAHQGDQVFQAQLEQQSDPVGFVMGIIRKTREEKGTDAAIAQTHRILAVAEEHQTMILGKATKH
jgi:hypothetical protein